MHGWTREERSAWESGGLAPAAAGGLQGPGCGWCGGHGRPARAFLSRVTASASLSRYPHEEKYPRLFENENRMYFFLNSVCFI